MARSSLVHEGTGFTALNHTGTTATTTHAASIGLAAIIGAFLAGMVVGESSEKRALEVEVAPVARVAFCGSC